MLNYLIIGAILIIALVFFIMWVTKKPEKKPEKETELSKFYKKLNYRIMNRNQIQENLNTCNAATTALNNRKTELNAEISVVKQNITDGNTNLKNLIDSIIASDKNFYEKIDSDLMDAIIKEGFDNQVICYTVQNFYNTENNSEGIIKCILDKLKNFEESLGIVTGNLEELLQTCSNENVQLENEIKLLTDEKENQETIFDGLTKTIENTNTEKNKIDGKISTLNEKLNNFGSSRNRRYY